MSVQVFNQCVRDILSLLERKLRREEDHANIERLRSRIALIKNTMGEDFVCKCSCDVFTKYNEQIVNRNDAFFLKLNIAGECAASGIKTDSNDDYIFALIDIIKAYYINASTNEKTKIWDYVKILFEASLTYRLTKK